MYTKLIVNNQEIKLQPNADNKQIVAEVDKLICNDFCLVFDNNIYNRMETFAESNIRLNSHGSIKGDSNYLSLKATDGINENKYEIYTEKLMIN